MKAFLTVVIVVLFGVLLIGAVNRDSNSDLVDQAKEIRSEILTASDLFRDKNFDELGSQEFKTRAYAGDQLAKSESSMAKISLKDSSLYLDYIARQARQLSSNEDVFTSINRVQSALAASHFDQALQIVSNNSLSDEDREIAANHLAAAKEFTEGLTDISDSESLGNVVEEQKTRLDEAIDQVRNTDNTNVNIIDARDGQIYVLEETGVGALGLVGTLQIVMSNAQNNLAIEDFAATRESAKNISSLLANRSAETTGEAKNRLDSAKSMVDEVANNLTAETGLTADELASIFIEVSEAMAVFEAKRASNVNIETDPRIVGLFLTASASHAEVANSKALALALEPSFSAVIVEKTVIAGDNLLLIGVDAVTNSEVQEVYQLLQGIEQ